MTQQHPCTYLPYRLVLEAPAIVSTYSSDPNSASTLSFIPGSTMRGVVASRLRGLEEHSELLDALVLSDRVRYLNAYPEAAGSRPLPMPVAWRRCKDDDGDRGFMTVYNLAAYDGTVDLDDQATDVEHWPDEALAGPPAPFVAVAGSECEMAQPDIAARIHHQRDRVKGRPWRGRDDAPHGALFAYEYLEAGQAFWGVIQLCPPADRFLDTLRQLLSRAPILIGRSRRGGYGGNASIEFGEPVGREYAHIFDALHRDVQPGEVFGAWLTSAYIGRCPHTGQLEPSWLVDELEARFGGAARVMRVRWSFERVGAFNRKWRLEVPQALAVAAGALLVLEADKPISVGLIERIECEGLGERRQDGFGRVLFVGDIIERQTLRLAKTDAQSAPSAPRRDAVPPHVDDAIGFVEARILLEEARQVLSAAAIRLAKGARNRPTNSLLGRLRTLFRGVLDAGTARDALKELSRWCGDDEEYALRDRAREQLDRCKVGLEAKPLRRWLRALALASAGPEGWDALVDLCEQQATLTGLAQSYHLTTPERALDILQAQEAYLRAYFVDALLAAMRRLNRRGGKLA